MTHELLPLAEAARRLHVSVRTLEREHAEGKLAIVRVRSVRLVSSEELARYIAACQEVPCQSAKSASATKSDSVWAAANALSARFRAEQPETTRARSKLHSAARKSTLRLVAHPRG